MANLSELRLSASYVRVSIFIGESCQMCLGYLEESVAGFPFLVLFLVVCVLLLLVRGGGNTARGGGRA